MAEASPEEWRPSEEERQWIHDTVDRLLDRGPSVCAMDRGILIFFDPDHPGWMRSEPDGSESLTIRAPPTRTVEGYLSGEYEEADRG